MALKSLSWLFASIIMIMDIAFIVRAAYGPDPATLTGPGENFPQWITMVLVILSPFYLTLIFYFSVIRLRLREIYKDSKLLHSLPKQALLYMLAILLYLVATGALMN